MKFLVIGLGNLGRAIAENLTRIGDEVIGVDLNLHKVEAVKQTISGSVSLDTTDRDALNTLPLSEMDAIFVTYGKNFGIRLVGVERAKEIRNLIGLKQTQYYVIDPLSDDLVLEAKDRLILFGKMEVLHKIKEL